MVRARARVSGTEGVKPLRVLKAAGARSAYLAGGRWKVVGSRYLQATSYSLLATGYWLLATNYY